MEIIIPIETINVHLLSDQMMLDNDGFFQSEDPASSEMLLLGLRSRDAPCMKSRNDKATFC